MRLIDILNGMHFAGADFLPAITAAHKRRTLLTPIFHKILAYAASQPEAYNCRFTLSLLHASALLLAEWNDPKFVILAKPLLSTEVEPNLFGDDWQDSACLMARAIRGNSRVIVDCLLEESCTSTFAEVLLGATAYIVAWYPHHRDEVKKTLIILIRHPMLSEFSEDVQRALVESCCRIGLSEILLDLYIASEEGKIPEKLIDDWITCRANSKETGVWIDTDRKSPPEITEEPFILEHVTLIEPYELFGDYTVSDVEFEALTAFNSVAAPCRDLKRRLVSIQKVIGINKIAIRVIRLASSDPEHFRTRHWHTALTSAICLGSIAGGKDVAEAFARLLQISSNGLDILLGDDLTEMCDLAFALAARDAITEICRVIEDSSADFSSRSVALEALCLQVRLGYLPKWELTLYFRSLMERWESIAGRPSFWYDVAKICADLYLTEMIPLLLDLVKLGLFVEPDGSKFMDELDLNDLFAESSGQVRVLDAETIDASHLLRHCSGHESMSVSELFSNLQSPNYG